MDLFIPGPLNLIWTPLYAILLALTLLWNLVLVSTLLGAMSISRKFRTVLCACMLNLGVVDILQVALTVPTYIISAPPKDDLNTEQNSLNPFEGHMLNNTALDWNLGGALCKMYHFFPPFTTSVGAFILVALTFASSRPLKPSRARWLVILSFLPWIFGCGLAVPYLLYSKMDLSSAGTFYFAETPLNLSAGCLLEFPSPLAEYVYMWVYIGLTYLLPAFIMLISFINYGVLIMDATKTDPAQRITNDVATMTALANLLFILLSFLTMFSIIYISHGFPLPKIIVPVAIFLEDMQVILRPVIFISFYCMHPDLKRDFRSSLGKCFPCVKQINPEDTMTPLINKKTPPSYIQNPSQR